MNRFLVVVWLMVSAGPAFSQVTKLTVAPIALDDASSRGVILMGQWAEAWVQRDERFSLVSLTTAGEEMGKSRAEGEAKLKAARDSLDSLEYDQAIEHAQEAIALLEKIDPQIGVPLALRATELLAQAQFFLGEVAPAEETLRGLLTVDLAHRFDTMRMVPQFQAVVDDVRREVDAVPTTTLEVQSRPVSGPVFVDGVLRGTSPVEVTGLRGGKHYVAVMTAGYKLEHRKELATPGRLVIIELEPAPGGADLRAALANLRVTLRGRESPAIASQVAKWAGTDGVIVLAAKTEDDEAMLRAVHVDATGAVVARVEQEIAGLDRANAAVIDGLLARLMTPRAAAAPSSPGLSISGPPATSWGAGAAGVAGIAVGVAFGLQSQAHRERANDATFVGGQREVGPARTKAIVANVGFGLGAVGIASAVFFWIQDGSDVVATVAPEPGGAQFAIVGRF